MFRKASLSHSLLLGMATSSIQHRRKWPWWASGYKPGSLGGTSKAGEELAPSSRVLLPLPDVFAARWLSHVCFRFINWERSPFPWWGVQVAGTTYPAPCPTHLYVVTIYKNKTLYVTTDILYTETAINTISENVTYFHAYTLSLYSPRNLLTYISRSSLTNTGFLY